MINTRTLLENELEKLLGLLASLPNVSPRGPKGCLRANHRGSGYTYYYQKRVKSNSGVKNSIERLGDGSSPKVHAIKAERFIRQLQKMLKKNIAALQKALQTAIDFDFDDVIAALPRAYRMEAEGCYGLFRPVMDGPRLSDKRRRDWINANYLKNPAAFAASHIAITGEIVRSKSELIIYDLLVKYGVPFRYECAIRLTDLNGLEVVRYPDFTILLADGSCLYWEHLGMLSDERYLNGTMAKLALYHKNGMTAGDNLILTSDSADGSINAEEIARIIEGLILPRI